MVEKDTYDLLCDRSVFAHISIRFTFFPHLPISTKNLLNIEILGSSLDQILILYVILGVIYN